MRVTLVSLALNGGIVHYAVCLANALARELSVRVIVPEGAQVDGYTPDVTVQALPVPMEFSWNEVKHSPRRALELVHFLQALRSPWSDVIHFLNRHEYLTVAAPLVSDRLVVTLHDPRPHAGEASARKLLANWMLRREARRIFVYGKILRQHLIEQGVSAEKIEVVPHGSFAEFAGSPDTSPDPQPTGLFFGRILPYKGLEVLLRAAPLIRRQVQRFRLLIAGDGDLAPYEHLLATERATGHLELHNRFIPDSELPTLLARSTVVLLPYLEATQSGVIPLAYGAQRPVVATAVGAIPEIIEDGRTGLLVPPNDALALAEATARVLLDPHFAASLALAGRQYAEQKLSWEAIAQQTMAVYGEVAHAGDA